MNTNSVINSQEQEPDWSLFGPSVRKIVLGRTPGDQEAGKGALRLDALPPDLATHFSSLTHLYLWGIEGLKALPPLPPTLKCLDLRGCKKLKSLPELPRGLETLDLGDCAALERLPASAPSALERFYFNGCTSLKGFSLGSFIESLKAARVVEIDGSGVPAITSLEEFPMAHLRRLVLMGCGQLRDISAIRGAKVLEHLNLSGCASLSELPDLPDGLRHLVLHGAANLRCFLGQDIGPYDRGDKGQNVIKAFLSRKMYGGELAFMAHAKVLLMGDGRVGKTTLAKRLRWEELSPQDQQLPVNQEIRPSPDEEFTPKVSFLPWETSLCLPDDEARALDERAASRGLKLAKGRDGSIRGVVRLWDFGGQEVYHCTHRIFASEGSIFLLVWRGKEQVLEPGPPEVAPEEWQEWNRRRPLDYWLDYIFSMRPKAQVALVCTNCPKPDEMLEKPDWKARAKKYKHLDLPVFFVDSLDETCSRHDQFQGLLRWIREACGREALRIGILQPRFYRQVSDLLNQWLEENSRARKACSSVTHLLCPWNDWKGRLELAHRNNGATSHLVLEEDDVTAITDYLHAAGHLFFIRHEAHRAVLVDQEWAADLIYRLLLCRGDLRRTVTGNGGWFFRADLEKDPSWKAIKDPVQRERLLAYMDECNVLKSIESAVRHPLGQEVFLAMDKWLLPTFEAVQKLVEARRDRLQERPGMNRLRKLDFGNVVLSEFEFRSLQAFLARTFGTRAVYFRNGLQATDSPNASDWCFRLRWHAEEKDPFSGSIDAILVCRESQFDRLAAEIANLLYGEGSPIARFRQEPQRSLPVERDLGREFYGALHHSDRDLAFSSSGADRADAESIHAALVAVGLRSYWYGSQECRKEEAARVMDFMNGMRRQPCILLLVSEGFLRSDPVNNWYCAWELADAILRLGDGRRSVDQTLVLFKESSEFKFSQFDETAHKLLKDMATYFLRAYGALDPADMDKYKHYHQFAEHFAAATRADNWSKFIEARGTRGLAIDVGTLKNHAGAPDFSSLIDLVARATGKRPVV